jgi:hypothetical protein
LVENDIDDNSPICCLLEDFIESKFRVLYVLVLLFVLALVSHKQEVWSYHPVGNVHIFLCILELIVQVFEVALPISIEGGGAIVADW